MRSLIFNWRTVFCFIWSKDHEFARMYQLYSLTWTLRVILQNTLLDRQLMKTKILTNMEKGSISGGNQQQNSSYYNDCDHQLAWPKCIYFFLSNHVLLNQDRLFSSPEAAWFTGDSSSQAMIIGINGFFQNLNFLHHISLALTLKSVPRNII